MALYSVCVLPSGYIRQCNTKNKMTMMDFNDPNEMWRHNGYDPYKGMSLKERQQAGCIHGVLFVVAVVVLIIAGFTYYTSVAQDQPFFSRFGEMAVISISVAVLSFIVGILAKRFLGVDL